MSGRNENQNTKGGEATTSPVAHKPRTLCRQVLPLHSFLINLFKPSFYNNSITSIINHINYYSSSFTLSLHPLPSPPFFIIIIIILFSFQNCVFQDRHGIIIIILLYAPFGLMSAMTLKNKI